MTDYETEQIEGIIEELSNMDVGGLASFYIARAIEELNKALDEIIAYVIEELSKALDEIREAA